MSEGTQAGRPARQGDGRREGAGGTGRGDLRGARGQRRRRRGRRRRARLGQLARGRLARGIAGAALPGAVRQRRVRARRGADRGAAAGRDRDRRRARRARAGGDEPRRRRGGRRRPRVRDRLGFGARHGAHRRDRLLRQPDRRRGNGGDRRGRRGAQHGLPGRAGRRRRHQPARRRGARRQARGRCCWTWPPRSWRSGGSRSSRRPGRNCRPASRSPPTASRPPTRPSAKVPTPVGGAKGAGMSLVFEMLASGLVANPIVPAYHSGTKEGRRHRQNGFLLAIDIAAFLPLEEFAATIDETVDAIKSLPPAAGTAGDPRPGERGRRTARDRAASRHPARPQGLARANRNRNHPRRPGPRPAELTRRTLPPSARQPDQDQDCQESCRCDPLGAGAWQGGGQREDQPVRAGPVPLHSRRLRRPLQLGGDGALQHRRPGQDARVHLLRVRGADARGASRFDGVVTTEHSQASYDLSPNPTLMAYAVAAAARAEGSHRDHRPRPLARQDPRTAEDRRGVRAARRHQRRPADRRVPGGPVLRRQPQRRPSRRSRRESAPASTRELILKAWSAKEPFPWNGRFEKYGQVNLLAPADSAAAPARLDSRRRHAGHPSRHPPQRLRVHVPQLGPAEARGTARSSTATGTWPRRKAATATPTGSVRIRSFSSTENRSINITLTSYDDILTVPVLHQF